jgi:adenylate cyclase
VCGKDDLGVVWQEPLTRVRARGMRGEPVAQAKVTRKLAAIVAADVAGYSRLMSADDAGTLAALRQHRAELIDPMIGEHGGRIVKTMGDGLLIEFPSVVDAVACVVAVQRAMVERNAHVPVDRRILFRVGVNVGDVIIEGSDIFGDGVNIASRLEGLAAVGGACISDKVKVEIESRLDLELAEGGAQLLKNIAQPVRVYHWHPDAGALAQAARRQTAAPRRQDEQKPTLCVEPFEALGDNEPTRILAAAASGEMASSLAKLTGISVVTTAADAQYVARGRLQTAANRYRATVQLHEQRAHKQIWSDRFEGDLSDTFQASDDLAMRISTALRYEIYEWETQKAKTRPIEEQSDEELLGLAGHILLGSNRAEWDRSRQIIDGVIARNPNNFMALAIRAVNAFVEVTCGYKECSREDAETGRRLIRRALEIKERSDFAHLIMGNILLYCERDIEGAMRETERSLELNPSYILAMDTLGTAKIFAGDVDAGIALCMKAVQADSRFPANNWMMENIATGHFTRGDYQSAIDWARRADQRQHDVPRAMLTLITSASHAGEPETARKEATRLLRACPEFRVGDLRRWPYRDPAHWGRFTRGLAEAGLPQ